MTNLRWIQIPRRLIRSKRGSVIVEPFEILSRPISAAEFALFAKKSGYTTKAEKANAEFTVYDNPAFEGIDFLDLSNVSAIALTVDDAAAFCRHYHVRLPTPDEWISFVRFIETKKLWSHPPAKRFEELVFSGPEWLEAKNKKTHGFGPLKILEGASQLKMELRHIISEEKLLLGATFRPILRGKTLKSRIDRSLHEKKLSDPS